MRAIGARLPWLDLDVIGFQEVWMASARETLLEAGRRAGFEHVWYNDVPLGGSGLLVISRLPILESHFERFRLGGVPHRLDHGDYYGDKGFAEIHVKTPLGPVVLMNTHLHARYGSDVDHEYRGHRTGEIIQLVARMRKLEHPIAAVGDFNLVESDAEYRIFRGLSGSLDSALVVGNPEPTKFHGNPYRSRNSNDRRKDFIFQALPGFVWVPDGG